MNDFFQKINDWYESHCDGIWEHGYGIKLETLDNPGWILKIDGEVNRVPLNFKVDNSDDDWISITATQDNFMGAGGIHNLNQILEMALQWLEIK